MGGDIMDDKTPTGCPISHHASSFDVFEGDYQVNPAEALRWSRDKEPVFYNPKLKYWIVSRYDDVKAVFRDNILFSPSIALEKITPAPPEAEEILKSYGYAMNRTLVNEDEPAHMERRRVLLESFAPEELEKHKPAIRQLTREYMDRFIDNGKADLVSEMFQEIPLMVALHFLGVSDDDIEKLRNFSVAHTVNTWGKPSADEQLNVAHSVGKFWQTATEILENMKAEPDGKGWMHHTIRQHLKYPDVVTESYLRSMMMAILAAAHETTSNATVNTFKVLLSNRENWQEICDNPKLIPNAVEECLRYEGSVAAWRRRATVATNVGGVDIPSGAKLLIVLASANHDERHFENPDEIDLYRENTTDHLTFGYGSHQCMGKNIARMEMRIFLEEFTKRLPHLELVADQHYDYLPNTSFRGPSSLWVKWDPTKNPESLAKTEDFKIGPPSKHDLSRRVKITEINNECDDVVRLVIEHPKASPLPNWSPGSHIDVIFGGFNRKYSLCGPSNAQGRYELAILKETEGRGGSFYIHENIKVGDMINIVGPKNHFRLDEGASDYLLIAGGIGITPIIAMADRLKELSKPYKIHYAGRRRSSMAFVDRLERDHSASLNRHHYIILFSATDCGATDNCLGRG
ncbi:MAG: cytochrome P450 [Kordiimonadaceae bacterium]|nr:cytochrome P450 [Kordiimonadaceae bacterium]MBT6330030.1 cytochrome P450 [Kordiimonadaceae bacterium]